MSEGKAPLHVMIPSNWKEELEKMAKEKNVSIADVARELIDQGLHGKAQAAPAQAVKCQDDVARQVIRMIIDLLQLYVMMERENKS
jgi:hypothetical protein